jgi:hypothetical protein
MSDFVGYLKVKGIRRLTSETVKKETDARWKHVCKRRVREANPHRILEVMDYAQEKCRWRCAQLWGRVEILPLVGDLPPVKLFYETLQNNPDTRARLEKVKETHSAQEGLLPEYSDMVILSEAIVLKRSTGKDIYFISKDGHFCEFSKEIGNVFSVKVKHLQKLNELKTELDNSQGKLESL